jgi:hypothetical protein
MRIHDITVVGLAPGIRVMPGALVDVDARTYPVDGLGEAVCRVISEPAELGTVLDGLAELHELERAEVIAGLAPFLAELERSELLSRNASFLREAATRLVAIPVRLAVAVGTRHPMPAARGAVRRYPADARGLSRAIIEAHQGLCWLGVVLVLGGAVAALALAPDATVAWLGLRTAALFGAGYTLLVLLTIAVHEAAHLVAARISRATLFASYARLGAAGISATTTSRARRMAIAAAGPLAALAVNAGVVAVIRFGPDAFWAHAAVDQLRLSALVAAAVLGLAQLVCLTPLTADGRQLRDAWRAGRAGSVRDA